MNNTLTSVWENKSQVRVRRGGGGQNKFCNWQLSFILYSLKIQADVCVCVCALCVLSLLSKCICISVREKWIATVLAQGYQTFSHLFLCFQSLCNSVFFSFFPLVLPDLIHCTNEMNVNIPQLADTLFERTANSSWVVVFKALITTHHLMMYGNEVGGLQTITHYTHKKPPSRAPRLSLHE